MRDNEKNEVGLEGEQLNLTLSYIPGPVKELHS